MMRTSPPRLLLQSWTMGVRRRVQFALSQLCEANEQSFVEE